PPAKKIRFFDPAARGASFVLVPVVPIIAAVVIIVVVIVIIIVVIVVAVVGVVRAGGVPVVLRVPGGPCLGGGRGRGLLRRLGRGRGCRRFGLRGLRLRGRRFGLGLRRLLCAGSAQVDRDAVPILGFQLGRRAASSRICQSSSSLLARIDTVPPGAR